MGEFLQKEMHVFFAENEGKDKEKLEQWEQEHWEMLCRIAPAQFTVRHWQNWKRNNESRLHADRNRILEKEYL